MYTRKELKMKAKEQIKGKIGSYFLCNLVFFLSLFIPMIILGFGASSINLLESPLLGLFVYVIIFFIGGPMTVGLYNLYLKSLRYEKISVKDTFYGFSFCLRSVAVYFFYTIFISLWSLLFVIPGIIKSFSYAMSYFVIAERPELTALQAIKESRRIMKGHKFEFFVLQLSFIPWHLLAMVTFGIAYIYVQPYMMQTYANFYEQIKDKTEMQ